MAQAKTTAGPLLNSCSYASTTKCKQITLLILQLYSQERAVRQWIRNEIKSCELLVARKNIVLLRVFLFLVPILSTLVPPSKQLKNIWKNVSFSGTQKVLNAFIDIVKVMFSIITNSLWL